MKKTPLSLSLFAFTFTLAFAVAPGIFVEAQTPTTSAEITAPALPNPGLKPGDFFYFLDVWGERVQGFFTLFNPENRTMLQTRLALERVAEVNALLEARGVDAPGLSVAHERMRQHMERANRILERQRARGVEISGLAKRLEAEFDTRQNELESVFEAQEARLEARIEEKEAEIEAALLANNFQRVVELRARLTELRAEQERLIALKERQGATLDIEEEKMEAKMEARERERDALEDEARRAFNEQKRELKSASREKWTALQEERRTLEMKLRDATVAGDAALIEQIKSDIADVRTEAQTLRKEQKTLRDKLREMREKVRVERPNGTGEVSFETIKKSSQSGHRERAMSVVRTEEEWALLGGKLARWWESPDIDFSIYMVIAVFQGLQNTGGFSVTITDVVEYEDRLKVFVTETSPGPDDFVTQVLTQPAHIIKLERIEKEVVFEVKKENERPPRRERPEPPPRFPPPPMVPPGLVPPRELPVPIVPPGLAPPRETMSCRTDFDCLGLICPMVIGGDTPQCNEGTGTCFCGPGSGYPAY